MQTALLHLLPAQGPAAPAHAVAPMSAMVPSGPQPDFGEALTHAASDLSATGVAGQEAAAPRLRRHSARGEPADSPVRDSATEPGAAAPRGLTPGGGPRHPAAADAIQAADQEAERGATSEKARDEQAGAALTPWLAALVGAASPSVATPVSATTASAEPAKAAVTNRQAPGDGSAPRRPRGTPAADVSASAPDTAQASAALRTRRGDSGATPTPTATAAHGAGDPLRSAAGHRPGDATGGPPREEGSATAKPPSALRTESTLARAAAAARPEAGPSSGTPGPADRILTVQVAGEKVRVELGPRAAANMADRRPAAPGQAPGQPAPSRSAMAEAVATAQDTPADAASAARRPVPADAAATSRSAARGADGSRDLHRIRSSVPGAQEPNQPRAADAERRAQGVVAKGIDASSEAALTSTSDLAAARRGAAPREAEGAGDGERVRSSPTDAAAAGDAAPFGRLRDSLHASSPSDRSPADGVVVAVDRGVDAADRADLRPRQTPIRPQTRAQDTVDTADADAASRRSAAARGAQATDIDPAGTSAPLRAPAASASDAISDLRSQDPRSRPTPPMDTSAVAARRAATAAPGPEAARALAADRANPQPGPSRTDAGRWRAGHPGSVVTGTSRGRTDGAAEGTESAAAVEAPTPPVRSSSAGAAQPSSTPGASSTAAAPALAATTAPTAMPAQAGATAHEPYRRPALLQGGADQAGGPVRPGAGAGAEPGRMKRGPGGTDADPTLRRSTPDATTPAGEAQASAWMRALEAAIGSPADREARADASSLTGTAATFSVQDTGFSAGRATGAAPEAATPAARVEAALNSPEFAPMLGARIAALVRDGIEQARIALNPQEMGPVSVQLALDGSKVTVELAAEVEATRAALEQALPTLAGALHEAGFTLAGGGVFQQSRDSGGAASQQDPTWTGRESAPVVGVPQAAAAPAGTARAGQSQGLVDLYA